MWRLKHIILSSFKWKLEAALTFVAFSLKSAFVSDFSVCLSEEHAVNIHKKFLPALWPHVTQHNYDFENH